MLPQPSLGVAPPGADRIHFTPESPRMVGLPHVHELVVDDVIGHRLRHLHQPPVQRDHVLRGAGAPARPLIAHGHIRDANAGFARKRAATFGQFIGGQSAKLRFNRLPHIGVRSAKRNGLFTKLRHRTGHRNGNLLATKPGARSGFPGCMPLALSIELAADPRGLTRRECEASCQRRAARHSQTQTLTVRREPHNVPARKTMPRHQDRHRLPFDRQLAQPLYPGLGRIQPRQLELHEAMVTLKRAQETVVSSGQC